MTLRLSTAQLDRAAGVLLGMACGDALGAGYEFGPPLSPDVPVTMTGGGSFGWEPGEWTDDTSMAIAIAEVSAKGADLRSSGARDQVAARWAGWGAEAKDVGNQTRAVLSTAGPNPTGATLAEAAALHHARTARSGGNGSLMRTAPIALAYLDDPEGTPKLGNLPQPVEGAIIAVPKERSEQAVREAVEAKVPRLWIQNGCESQAAIDLAAQSGVPLVSGHCVMMYAEPVQSVHAFHRWLAKVFGSLAK